MVIFCDSSGGHRLFVGSFDDYNWEKSTYHPWEGYGQGKAANVLFSVALAQRGIRSLSPSPGGKCGSITNSVM